jgi:hypothetical protein
VYPITNSNKIGAFKREYGMNFAGHPLMCIEFFGLDHINENIKHTYKYDEYRKFIHFKTDIKYVKIQH